MSAQKVYQQTVNEDNAWWTTTCHTNYRNQVKNFQKEESRHFRISHDAVYNTYQLCFQLQFNNRKGEPTDFLQHLQVYPTVCAGAIMNWMFHHVLCCPPLPIISS